MTRESIGEHVDLAALATLHRPKAYEPLAYARDQVRRALSALRTVDRATVSGEMFTDIARLAAWLSDLEQDIDRINRKAQRS